MSNKCPLKTPRTKERDQMKQDKQKKERLWISIQEKCLLEDRVK
jgi:3-phenylpropionate/cinnamic acid dioxygenase small subunit